MYKDKEKQRLANKERQRRYKARHKGVTSEGVTQGVTAMIEDVRKNGGEYTFKTVKGEIQDVHHTKGKRSKYIDAQGNANVPDAEFTRLLSNAGPGHVRVSKPGDADYVPMCETTRRFCQGRGAG